MIIVVDGNDGTGKSTLVEQLLKKKYVVKDRGIPTQLTDNPKIKPLIDELYIILDIPVEVSQQRLLRAGRDLNEKYHTKKDLIYYRKQFLKVAKMLGKQCVLIDALGSPDEVLKKTVVAIEKYKNKVKKYPRVTKLTP